MNTIVALIDFSDVTAKVLNQARESAKLYGDRVILMHFVPKEPVVIDLGIVSPIILKAPSEERIKADYEILLSYRDSLAKAGIVVLIRQLLDGNVNKILKDCLRWDAELIIMGSHHHSPLYNLIFGKFTKDIFKRAHCPVHIVAGDES
jgi:nucleotide-binding universal stress UspA family protein